MTYDLDERQEIHMNGDIRYFRRKLFGGFDSRDVMRYIEELAGQRNTYKMTGDKMELELKKLNGEIKRLQNELDEADRRIKDTLGEASSNIASFKDKYASIQTEMETTTNAISNELAKLNSTLTDLSDVIDQTGSRFTELQAMVGHNKPDFISSKAARFII